MLTAQELAQELLERGLPAMLVCEAGAIMVQADPQAMSEVMGLLGSGMLGNLVKVSEVDGDA